MKICVFCGKEIKPDEKWTTVATDHEIAYAHYECYKEAEKEFKTRKYLRGEPITWEQFMKEKMAKSKKEEKTYIEELEEKLSKAGLDYIFEEVKKEKSEITFSLPKTIFTLQDVTVITRYLKSRGYEVHYESKANEFYIVARKEVEKKKILEVPGKVNFIPMFTIGFRALPADKQAEMLRVAYRYINPKTDFIVFDPEAKEISYEDEGRTLRYPMPGIPETCYAKLDDFGSPEILSREIGYKVNTRYVVTFMLASEY